MNKSNYLHVNIPPVVIPLSQVLLFVRICLNGNSHGTLSPIQLFNSSTKYLCCLILIHVNYCCFTIVTAPHPTPGVIDLVVHALNHLFPAPPSAPTITSLISTYSDQLTVTWTFVPTATSYNVSINDSVNTLVTIPSTGAPQYTFTGLTNNTVYTVSVVAINCAGSSSPAIMTNRTKQCEY